MSPNLARFIILVLKRPLSSIISNNIWLFDRPGKSILPVYSSYSVQPTDQISMAGSYG